MRKERLYYFETSIGAGLRLAYSAEQARYQLRKEVGTMTGIGLVRKATEQDIAWVQAMGGYIPEIPDTEE